MTPLKPADAVRTACDLLWQLTESADSHLVRLEHRLTILQRLASGDAQQPGASTYAFAVMTLVEDAQADFNAASAAIDAAYRALDSISTTARTSGGAR